MKNEVSLSGRICLVTGGAQGIGWAITQALAARGAHVYACDIAQSHIQQAEMSRGTLPWGGNITLSECDVANRDMFERWITDIYDQTGRIDVFVNNAIFFRWGPVVTTSVEDAQRTMEVGFYGMMYATKRVLPYMLAAGRGHIINIGSAVSQAVLLSDVAAYTAVKCAIDGYTQSLHVELKDTPIHVALIRPTTVAGTAFLQQHIPASWIPRMTDFTPVVTPPDVARAVIRAIRGRHQVVNVPGYLPILYLIAALVPGPLRWLITKGGTARRNYAAISWEYTPRQRRLNE